MTATTAIAAASDLRLVEAVKPLLETEETLDLPPDRDGQQHARHEEDEKHEPESDSGAPRPLPMCDPGLSACSLQPNGVSDGLVVDDGYVVRRRFTCLMGHG